MLISTNHAGHSTSRTVAARLAAGDLDVLDAITSEMNAPTTDGSVAAELLALAAWASEDKDA